MLSLSKRFREFRLLSDLLLTKKEKERKREQTIIIKAV